MPFFTKDPLKTVEDALTRRGWKYQRMGTDHVLTGFLTGAGAFMLGIHHDLERKTLLFLMNPAKTPADMLQSILAGNNPMFRVHTAAGHTEEQVQRVCELLLNLNYGMLLGGLERDQSDGEIRFRVALPYRDTTVSIEQVNWCAEVAATSCVKAVEEIQKIVGARGGMEV